MSIFKQTLSKTIQDQLKARTAVVSGKNDNRNQLLPWYLSKNAWVRMTSMVNYTSGKIKFPGDGSIEIIEDGHYTNDKLAKKNILEGGQLYVKNNNGQDIAALRQNIVSNGGAYGGSFDLRGDNTADPNYTRQFGIRPMPGITSVSLNTVSAYGSLFETTVNFYAWDNHQLNELETLFMRPGYSVLLEWGWSQYISNNNIPTVFNGLTLPAFSNLSQQEIYDKLEALRIKHDHNYDGMLGYVKNFSWKMLKGGGYECSTTLISMGEAISSLKISTNNLKLRSKKPNFDFTLKDNYVYDDFENIFISLKGEAEIFKVSENNRFIDEEEYKGKWNYDKNYYSRAKIAQKIKDTRIIERLQRQPVIKKIKSGDGQTTLPEGQNYEYISLDVFVAIINSHFNFTINSEKNTLNTEKLVKILPPSSEDYCLASRDSISVDPSVCLISNSLAFKEEFVGGLNPNSPDAGVKPKVKLTLNKTNSNYYRSGLTYLEDFYDPDRNVGLIENIYVNIDLLLNEYKNIKNTSNEEGVNLSIYFKNILNRISNALGGLNNFSLSTAGRDQNTLRIIDLYYLEQNESNNKYTFDLMGLGSIVRDANIESQIFENQSTMVAIAAQSKANLGDIYNSTQVYLNAGIKDRVALAKFQPGEEEIGNEGSTNNSFYAKVFDFLLYVRENILGDPNDEFSISTSNSGTVPYSFLKQFMLKYNGELNFKALLPFKLTIKLDGIGGIVVGEIFKVNKDILPKNYADKNLGFIITRISHTLNNNDWETTLESQICLLDHKSLGKEFIKYNRNGFREFIGEGTEKGLLYPSIVNYLAYMSLRSFIILLEALKQETNNSFPLNAAVLYFDNSKSKNIQDVNNYWVNNINLKSFTNTTGNRYNTWVEKWGTTYRSSLSSDQLNIKITSKKTLSEGLTNILKDNETIQKVDSLFENNIRKILTEQSNKLWDGVFVVYNDSQRKTKSNDVREGGKPILTINYTRLTSNVEDILYSNFNDDEYRTIYNSYYSIPFESGDIQPSINPIESNVFFGKSTSMYQRFNIYEIVTNFVQGTSQFKIPVSEKSIVENYYNDIQFLEKTSFNDGYLFDSTYIK